MRRGDTGSPGPRRAVLAVVLPAVLALLLGACGPAPGPASNPAPAAAPAPTAPGARSADAGVPRPRFTSCDDDFECATVPAPVDYADPGGPTLPIAIVRQPARDRAHRIGVLLVNPGGPGGSGIDTVESGTIPPEVADRFDLIGFDPRGVGRSGGLACPVPPDSPYAGDPDPSDPGDEAATQTAVDRYDRSCGDRYRDLLPHLGTRNVASDMDRIRAALGEQQISYLGFSYGTAIGQVYAQMFPQRVRAMVLDGVVDVSKPGLDPAQPISFENALHQFASACTSDPDCPVRPDPIAVLDRVHQRVAATPMPVAGSTPLSAGLLEIGVSYPLYNKDNWPALSSALAAADQGDGGPMRKLADGYFQGSNSDTYNAVSCLDSAWPRDVGQAVAASRATQAQAPHFSGNTLVTALTCAGWPVTPQVLTPLTGWSGPPLLVIGTTNDPATPYQNSVNLAHSLPGSALLTHRGDGHTAYTGGDDCIDDQVNRYLLDRTLPATPTC